MKLNKPIVVLDIESTGLSLENDEIIQFAAAKIGTDGKTKEEMKFLCKPSILVPKEASDIHGITNEMLINEPSFSQFAPAVVEFIGDCDVSGYNIANFDLVILDRQLMECGLKDVFINCNILDTFQLYKDHLPRKLENCYKYYTNKDLINAHDALVDVTATVEVLLKQLKIENKPFEELSAKYNLSKDRRIGFSDKIKYNDKNEVVIGFGKFKDIPIDKVDRGYLYWIVNKSDLPIQVKSYVQKYINDHIKPNK